MRVRAEAVKSRSCSGQDQGSTVEFEPVRHQFFRNGMVHQTEMVIASGAHFLVLLAVDSGLKSPSVHPQIGPDRTIPSVRSATCTTRPGGVVHTQHCALGSCPDSVGG